MKAENAGQAQSMAIVDELIRCGLKHACLSPGSRSTPMALALADRPEIDLHVSIDERSMSFLALGIAKASARPVAMLTTSGTATAHLYPAIIEADYACVPLIVLTADRPPELRDTGAGQTIDQIKLYGDTVRWFCEVGVAEPRAESVPYWRAIACRAYHSSLWPVPGPVHLNLAFRNPLVPVPDDAGFPFELEGRPGGKPWTEGTGSPLAPSAGDVARLADEVELVERGLVVAGTSDLDPSPIVELAATLGWPLLAEATSNARQGPNAVSTYDALLRVEGFWESRTPELVLRFGHLGTSNQLAAALSPSVRQVAVNARSWLDPMRAVSWIVRADPGLLCKALIARIEPRRSGTWLDSWLAGESKARRAIDSFLDRQDEVTEPGVARDVAATLPAGSNLMVASSMPVRDLDWFMRSSAGVRVIANRGANGIDGFVSSCLGVALSGSRSPTVGLSGDLSLLHDRNGLLLASDAPLDIVFVVLNNNGGGIFSFLPQAGHPRFERLFGTPHDSDFAPLAESCGFAYRAIHSSSDLAPALQHAMSAGGPHILEAQTNRQRNVEIHNLIWSSVAETLSS